MDKNGNLVLKQGKLVPDGAMGLGYFLLLAYVFLMYYTWANAMLISLWSVLLVLPATIFFSKKEVVFNFDQNELFTRRFLIMGLIPIERVVRMDNYKLFIIRTVSKSYRLRQSSSLRYVGNTMDLQEKYLAIQGIHKTTGVKYEICKGTQEELDEVIKHFIVPNNFQIFAGVPKKGFEYRPKN